MSQPDDLDREEEALRAWVSYFTRKGAHRQADMIQRDIDRMWEMRARRGWTSRLRPQRHGVEDFGSPAAPSAVSEAHEWTREAYE